TCRAYGLASAVREGPQHHAGWTQAGLKLFPEGLSKQKGLLRIQRVTCELCNRATETQDHLLFHCSVAQQFWQRAGFVIDDTTSSLCGNTATR
ncbi:hypothetical protein EJB05_24987, partial [Eragrostis curvula]